MNTMNLYRSQFRRLAELDRAIRSGKHPNCSSFAREYEVSRRTVARDIEFLKERGAPLEFDSARNGYRYTDRSWRLPALDLTEGELFLLLVAGQMARRFGSTPLSGALDSLFEKLAAALPESVSVDPAGASEQFSFHGGHAREINPRVWSEVVESLRASKVLRMTYTKVGTDQAERRTVEPVHIACVADEWYLVARCRDRDALRHFSIARIELAEPLAEGFFPPEFDPERYFSNRFGRFIGQPDKTTTVTVRFRKSAAPWVLERIWHPKQKVKRHRDGGVTLSMPVPSLYEAKRWILSWGAEAKVVGPVALRWAVEREVMAMASDGRRE